MSWGIYGEIIEVCLDPFNTETKANYLHCFLQQEEDHYWPGGGIPNSRGIPRIHNMKVPHTGPSSLLTILLTGTFD